MHSCTKPSQHIKNVSGWRLPIINQRNNELTLNEEQYHKTFIAWCNLIQFFLKITMFSYCWLPDLTLWSVLLYWIVLYCSVRACTLFYYSVFSPFYYLFIIPWTHFSIIQYNITKPQIIAWKMSCVKSTALLSIFYWLELDCTCVHDIVSTPWMEIKLTAPYLSYLKCMTVTN